LINNTAIPLPFCIPGNIWSIFVIWVNRGLIAAKVLAWPWAKNQ